IGSDGGKIFSTGEQGGPAALKVAAYVVKGGAVGGWAFGGVNKAEDAGIGVNDDGMVVVVVVVIVVAAGAGEFIGSGGTQVKDASVGVKGVATGINQFGQAFG